MENHEARRKELKNKIRNPQAASQLRVQLSESRETRKRYDPDAFLEFVKDNPAFHNLHVMEDEN